MKGMSDISMDQYLATDRGVVVYLESSDDVFVFKKWFGAFLSTIEFESISGERANGGCGTILKFFEDEHCPDFAYAVVDRDILLRNSNSQKYPDCKDLWWNPNDDDFYKAAPFPFNEKIFILNRWELENYLLHPEALQKLLNDKTRGGTNLTSAKKVAEKIIEHESDLIAVTLFSTVGKGTIKSMRHAQGKEGDALWEAVDQIPNSNENIIKEHQEKIEVFTEEKTNSIERWERLSRMLDGKRTMVRLDKILHNPKDLCLESEYGALAGHIYNLGLVDEQLCSWLSSIN